MKVLGIQTERRAVLYLTGDLVVALIAVAWGHILRFGVDVWPVDLVGIVQQSTGAVAFFVVTNLLALYLFEAYCPARDFRRPTQALRLWVAVTCAMVAQMVVFYALPDWWWGRGVTLLTNFGFAVLLTIWRFFSCLVRLRLDRRLRTLIIGDNEDGRLIAEQIRDHSEQRLVYRLVGFIDASHTDPGDAVTASRPPHRSRRRETSLRGEIIALPPVKPAPPLDVLGPPELLREVVDHESIDAIIVAIRRGMSPDLTAQLLDCKAAGVRIEDMRSVYSRLTGKVPIHQISDTSLIFGPEFAGSTGLGAALQRLADVAIALVGLVLSAPIVALAGAAVKLETKGPAFYLQERVGKDELPFTIIKLRTMGQDAEKATGAVWSQGAGDPRVTRVGRFLRRSRIDELPQFWNVFRGDMSMVGPRPERRHFVDQLKERIPFYGLRFAVKPGVTGWAQVKYRYGASEEDAAEKLCFDLFAVQHLTPALYALILLKTVQTVLMKPGS